MAHFSPRRSVVAWCLLATLTACQREAHNDKSVSAATTSASQAANSATLTTDADGHQRLEVTLVADSAAYAMGSKVREFLLTLVKGRDALASVTSIRFIAYERLVDKYGHESSATTAAYDLAMSDVLKINFDNVTTFGIMNLAQNMTIMHPAAGRDIEEFCRSEDGKYVQSFCETAQHASHLSATNTAR